MDSFRLSPLGTHLSIVTSAHTHYIIIKFLDSSIPTPFHPRSTVPVGQIEASFQLSGLVPFYRFSFVWKTQWNSHAHDSYLPPLHQIGQLPSSACRQLPTHTGRYSRCLLLIGQAYLRRLQCSPWLQSRLVGSPSSFLVDLHRPYCA